MTDKKCFVCANKGIVTGDKLIEKQAPGFGITGGLFICERHDKELNAKLEESAKPQQSRHAEDGPQS